MESIDVFLGRDGFGDALFVDVLRQRQLHDESVNVVVAVEFFDAGEEFLFRHRLVEADERRLEPAFLAGQHFILHVCFRASVVAHEDGGQMGLLAATRHALSYFFGNFRLDLVGGGFSVDELHYC